MGFKFVFFNSIIEKYIAICAESESGHHSLQYLLSINILPSSGLVGRKSVSSPPLSHSLTHWVAV